MNKIRVAICDDAPCVVDLIKMKLDDEQIEITGISYSAANCVSMMKRANADVLLIDIQMENETSGIDILPTVKKLFPDTKIIMLTGFDNENYIFESFANGADNYILKSFDSDICQTVKDTYNDNFSINSEIAKKLAFAARNISKKQSSMLYLFTLLSNLSSVEYEVLYSIYNGSTYKQIAKERFVEECTIKTHAQRILKKTDMHSMKELIGVLKKTQVFELLNPIGE